MKLDASVDLVGISGKRLLRKLPKKRKGRSLD